MILYRVSYFPGDFAAAVLPAAKAWLRIDHDDDDTALTSTIISAAAQLERQWDIAIIPASWDWTPTPEDYPALGFGYSTLYLPVRGTYLVAVDRAGVDVSDEYQFPGLYAGNYSQVPVILSGASTVAAPVWGDVFTLTAGVDVGAGVDYGVLDVLLRYTAFLWENREAAGALALHEVPDWLTRAWAPYWAPRV